jgi:hypothetical protein
LPDEPEVPNGLFPGRAAGLGGRGIPPEVPNGLFPGRAAGGFGIEGKPGTGFGVSEIVGVEEVSVTGAISSEVGSIFFGAAFLAGAFFATFSTDGLFTGGYFSRNFRTTGGSTVEDAERTNSPISWSFARTSLLSIPISFANS